MKHKKQGYQFVKLFDLKVGNIIQAYSPQPQSAAPVYYFYDDIKRRMQAICLQGGPYSDPNEIPSSISSDRSWSYIKEVTNKTGLVLSISKKQIIIVVQHFVRTLDRHETEALYNDSACLLVKIFD